jgi:hypothetical protein
MGTCNYHDGFVYDNSALDLKKYHPTEAMEELNREEFIALKDPKQKDDLERRKTRLKYICCDAIVQVGGTINGCKKGKHGFGSEKQRKAAGQVLDKKLVELWETACFENPEYNERWTDLFTKRRNI